MRKIIAIIYFALLAFASVYGQSAKEYFSLGCNASKNSNYAQAKEYFELSLALADTPQTNYNLANVCAKLNQIGLAKAYYMRAFYQDPRFREAQANLIKLDAKYNLPSPNTSKYDDFFDELSHNEWIIIASISLWTACLLLIILPLMKRVGAWQIFLGLVFALIFGLSSFGVSYWNSYAKIAVALEDNAPLKLSPTQDSPILSTLKQGQFVYTSLQKNNHSLASNTSGKKGWVVLDNKKFMPITK